MGDIVILISLKRVMRRKWRMIAIIAIAVPGLAACGHPGLKDNAENSIRSGATVDDAKKRHGVDLKNWEKPAYYLPNGNAVYIEPQYYGGGFFGADRRYLGCDYHWEANPQGRIVSYRLVGTGCCKHASLHDSLFCDQSQFEDPRLTKTK